jgi:isoleucyl-tRNA synthetase
MPAFDPPREALRMPLEKEDLKKTIHLPKTDFGMKANLGELEPRLLARWEAEDLYGKLRAARAGAPKYILHDGPPYASGELHIGTGMNKILKDFVLKFQGMRGRDVPYIPGWDCHGLPIERKALDEMQAKNEHWEKPVIRRRSEEFARKHIDGHRRQFKALGIFGRWADPYLTLDPGYEAAVIDVFGMLVEKGYVYRRRKPIHWCGQDQTALAEAELEYAERQDPSIFVRFPAQIRTPEKADRGAGLLVWTTTPWTLFGNTAIAVNADADYDVVRYGWEGASEISIVASALRERVLAAIGASDAVVLKTLKGAELAGVRYTPPFHYPREALVGLAGAAAPPAGASESEKEPTAVIVPPTAWTVVTAPYVSLEDGTGLVHTAPGHGREDYETALRTGLPVLSPVDAAGKLTRDVPEKFRGKFVLRANDDVIEDLKVRGILRRADRIRHSYPHCWRCHGPLIFRATEQWFVAVDHDGLRARMLDTVKNRVRFVPEWGETRISSMLADRPDWCISRQRAWGIPIPAFYCEGCNEPLVTKATCDRVRDLFAKEGANAWFEKPAAELLGPGFACRRCGGTAFRKEDDIFDVWFESGSSWHAVIDRESDLRYPADLYLEGSDQHRGWFQLSLLPAMAARGEPPFKNVVTHGFVVDEKGLKMSKSLGNYLSLEDGLKRFSADILRLYFSSIDYGDDVAVSVPLIEKMRDTYRKIRNTFRYLLGNLADFPGGEPYANGAELDEIDRFALLSLERVRREVEEAYEQFRFHKVYRLVHDLCAVELSTIYFEAIRDRLYCERRDDPRRRGAQQVLAQVLSTLARLLAPILVYTMEEVWDHLRRLPSGADLPPSVHLASWPAARPEDDDAEVAARWKFLIELRALVYQAIEPERKEGRIGEPTDALVTLRAAPAQAAILQAFGADRLAELFVVAGVTVETLAGAAGAEAERPQVAVARSPYPKCARCWVLRPSVRSRETIGAALCDRCADVLGEGVPA